MYVLTSTTTAPICGGYTTPSKKERQLAFFPLNYITVPPLFTPSSESGECTYIHGQEKRSMLHKCMRTESKPEEENTLDSGRLLCGTL